MVTGITGVGHLRGVPHGGAIDCRIPNPLSGDIYIYMCIYIYIQVRAVPLHFSVGSPSLSIESSAHVKAHASSGHKLVDDDA